MMTRVIVHCDAVWMVPVAIQRFAMMSLERKLNLMMMKARTGTGRQIHNHIKKGEVKKRKKSVGFSSLLKIVCRLNFMFENC